MFFAIQFSIEQNKIYKKKKYIIYLISLQLSSPSLQNTLGFFLVTFTTIIINRLIYSWS